MEVGGSEADDVLTCFKPIFNRARGILDPSSPHARNAALLPFLLHVYVSESGHLQLLTSDFHANTWHSRLSYEQLKELKEKLGCKESFSAFLQGLHEALSSDEVKIELGGPASAVGGKGATSAKLKAILNTIETSRHLVLDLDFLKGRSANDAAGALVWDLYDAFSAAQSRISELEANVNKERQRSTSVLNAIFEGKANSIHFRPSTLPNLVQKEVQPSLSDTSSPSILVSAESPVPSADLNSYLSSSLPLRCNAYPPVYSAASVAKPYKSLASADLKKKRAPRNSSLKLSEENSYSKAVKKTGKTVKNIIEGDVNENLPSGGIYETTECTDGPNASHSGIEKRKYRELNSDLLTKIESGGENRSAKTDAWARRHYAEWQKNCGLPERDIEEISLPDFSESLVKFFCMVKKRNGHLFPSESLKAMYRGFVRILQSHYKKLSLQGSYSGPIIDAGKDLLFEKARLSCMEAMKHSLLHGASTNKKRKVDEVLPVLSEDILACADNHITTPKGLCRRLCYYAIHKFGINGHMELYDTADVEFRRIVSEQGDIIWEYDEKRAEKYKSKELFRPVIQCGDKDVVECLDEYFMHLPPKPLEEEARRLFLAPIKHPTTDVWFRHQNISARTLLEWYRCMGPVALELVHATQNSADHSPCLLRCSRSCDGKVVDSDTDPDVPAMDIRSGHMRDDKKRMDEETFGKVVDVTSNTDEDSVEHHAVEDHEDLTDGDSHE